MASGSSELGASIPKGQRRVDAMDSASELLEGMDAGSRVSGDGSRAIDDGR